MLRELCYKSLFNIIKKTETYLKIESDTLKLPIRQREKIRRKFLTFYKWKNNKLLPICVIAKPNYHYDISFSDLKVSHRCICDTEGKVKLSCDFGRNLSV